MKFVYKAGKKEMPKPIYFSLSEDVLFKDSGGRVDLKLEDDSGYEQVVLSIGSEGVFFHQLEPRFEEKTGIRSYEFNSAGAKKVCSIS